MAIGETSREVAAGFDRMWADLLPLGRVGSDGGYRRFAWTEADLACREWFAQEATRRGLDLVVDRNGNQWAWQGDPDTTPGVVTGSHLDSVPDGGAYDGPLGVVSAFAALDQLRGDDVELTRPVAVVNFTDEEGARFGVACAGSRLMTGVLDPDRARALTDDDGLALAEAMSRAGADPTRIGKDAQALSRVGAFVELHVEQGRGLVHLGAPVGVASSIWPHGRWRFDFTGEANHAGTTRIEDRRDPMLAYARAVLGARHEAKLHDVLATFGRVRVRPNGTNAIPSLVQAWLDARGPEEPAVREVVQAVARHCGGEPVEESWTPVVDFDPQLRKRLVSLLENTPVLPTGAGHDAGILATAAVPAAMLFVRNPSGVSHSPAEHADRDDCLAGVAALAKVIRELAA